MFFLMAFEFTITLEKTELTKEEREKLEKENKKPPTITITFRGEKPYSNKERNPFDLKQKVQNKAIALMEIENRNIKPVLKSLQREFKLNSISAFYHNLQMEIILKK